MGTMMQYIEREAELRERFVRRTFEKNPRIKDFVDFQQSLFEAFDTERGKRAKNFFGDEEIMALFKSEECKAHLRQNVSEEEFNKIYSDAEQGAYSVMRKSKLGEPIKKPEDVFTITTPKKIRIEKQYTRTVRGKKISVKPYNRGFNKWSASQIRFIRIRRQAGILTPKQIVYSYNSHFMTEPRTESSIKTKMFRISKPQNIKSVPRKKPEKIIRPEEK